MDQKRLYIEQQREKLENIFLDIRNKNEKFHFGSSLLCLVGLRGCFGSLQQKYWSNC